MVEKEYITWFYFKLVLLFVMVIPVFIRLNKIVNVLFIWI